MSAVSIPIPMTLASRRIIGCAPLRGACLSRSSRDRSISAICSRISSNRATSRRNSASVFGGRWLAFRGAQRPESLACPAQLDLEAANTKADQRRLDAVHDAGLLADQRLTPPVRTTGIVILSGWNRCHAAVLWLAAQPAEQRPHHEAGIQSVCLCPPVFGWHPDAGR